VFATRFRVASTATLKLRTGRPLLPARRRRIGVLWKRAGILAGLGTAAAARWRLAAARSKISRRSVPGFVFDGFETFARREAEPTRQGTGGAPETVLDASTDRTVQLRLEPVQGGTSAAVRAAKSTGSAETGATAPGPTARGEGALEALLHWRATLRRQRDRRQRRRFERQHFVSGLLLLLLVGGHEVVDMHRWRTTRVLLPVTEEVVRTVGGAHAPPPAADARLRHEQAVRTLHIGRFFAAAAGKGLDLRRTPALDRVGLDRVARNVERFRQLAELVGEVEAGAELLGGRHQVALNEVVLRADLPVPEQREPDVEDLVLFAEHEERATGELFGQWRRRWQFGLVDDVRVGRRRRTVQRQALPQRDQAIQSELDVGTAVGFFVEGFAQSAFEAEQSVRIASVPFQQSGELSLAQVRPPGSIGVRRRAFVFSLIRS